MLTYTMDVLPESIWLRTTPGASAMGQPYVCTEAGQYLATAANPSGTRLPPVSTAGTTIGCIWTAQAWQQWRNGLFRRGS